MPITDDQQQALAHSILQRRGIPLHVKNQREAFLAGLSIAISELAPLASLDEPDQLSVIPKEPANDQ